MSYKEVLQLNENGYYIGKTEANESPLEPGVFLIPALAIDEVEPVIPDNHLAKWNGSGWDFEEIPAPKEDTLPEITPEQELQHKIGEAYSYAFEYISNFADGLGMVKIKDLKDTYPDNTILQTMIQECSSWCDSVWGLYRQYKTQILNGESPIIDYSVLGQSPHKFFDIIDAV